MHDLLEGIRQRIARAREAGGAEAHEALGRLRETTRRSRGSQASMRIASPILLVLVFSATASAQRQLDLTGKPDAAIREGFTRVTGVRELPGGRAIMVDQWEQSVYVVDFTKGSAEKIGRQGDGPAEYRFPLAPQRGRGDTTWIFDPTLRRMMVILDGKIATTVPMPAGAPPGGLAEPHNTDREGRTYFEGSGFDPDRGTFLDSVVVVRWHPREARIETVTRTYNGGRVRFTSDVGPVSQARSSTPFPHIDAWAVLPGGEIAVVRQSPFRIDVVGADGTVKIGTPVAFTPIAITQQEKDSIRARTSNQRVTATGRGGGGGQQFRRPSFPDDAYPKEMPAFVAASVRATPEGEVWVGRSRRVNDAHWRYDIFDIKGAPAGSAILSARAVIVGFGVGTVYVARTDPSDDLVYLERYRR